MDSTEPKHSKNWLLLLSKAQVSNKAALDCGSMPWILFVFLGILIVSIMSFPLALARIRMSTAAAEPQAYPGLGRVFYEIEASLWDFSVAEGRLKVEGKGILAQQELGQYQVIVEEYGGLMPPEPLELDENKGLLFFGRSQFTVIAPGGMRLDGSYRLLDGWSSPILRRQAQVKNRGDMANFLTQIFLGSAAMGELSNVILSLVMVTLIQILMYIPVIALLFSFSSLKVGAFRIGAKEKFNFGKSLRIVLALAFGIASLTALATWLIPFLNAGWVWLIFPLGLGTRVIFVYMGLFKNKKKTKSVTEADSTEQ